MQAYRTKSILVTYQYASYGMAKDSPTKTSGLASHTFTMRGKRRLGPSDISALASIIAKETNHDHISILSYQYI